MNDSSKVLQGSRVRALWKPFAVIVTLVAVVWVAFLFADAWPTLAAHRHEIRQDLLLGGLILAIASAYLTFEAFGVLLGEVGVVRLPRPQVAHLHFTGQLLKHLPGRIWGVGYQWALGRTAGPLSVWFVANMAHMVLAAFFALWTAGIVLAAARHLAWGGVAMGIGIVVYVTAWRLLAHPAVSNAVQRLPGRLGKLTREMSGALAAISDRSRLQLFLTFSGSSLLLYLAWALFGAAYPLLGPAGGAQLCAYYMVAWFVGYIAFVAPSGLGVRELVFAWLAHGYGGDTVAYMAILGRVSLLTVDIAMGLVFAPFAPRRN